jgi:hypothetical protein
MSAVWPCSTRSGIGRKGAAVLTVAVGVLGTSLEVAQQPLLPGQARIWCFRRNGTPRISRSVPRGSRAQTRAQIAGADRGCPTGLYNDPGDGRVDAGDVARVASDDCMLPLSSAQHDVHVNDVIMTAACAHQPHASGHAQRHDRDVNVGRLEQPGESNLTRAPPGLRDYLGRDADGSAPSPGSFQAGLHCYRLGRLVQRQKGPGIEREPGRRRAVQPAILPLGLADPVRPTWSSSASTCRRVSSGTGVSSRQAARISSRRSRS